MPVTKLFALVLLVEPEIDSVFALPEIYSEGIAMQLVKEIKNHFILKLFKASDLILATFFSEFSAEELFMQRLQQG